MTVFLTRLAQLMKDCAARVLFNGVGRGGGVLARVLVDAGVVPAVLVLAVLLVGVLAAMSVLVVVSLAERFVSFDCVGSLSFIWELLIEDEFGRGVSMATVNSDDEDDVTGVSSDGDCDSDEIGICSSSVFFSS